MDGAISGRKAVWRVNSAVDEKETEEKARNLKANWIKRFKKLMIIQPQNTSIVTPDVPLYAQCIVIIIATHNVHNSLAPSLLAICSWRTGVVVSPKPTVLTDRWQGHSVPTWPI